MTQEWEYVALAIIIAVPVTIMIMLDCFYYTPKWEREVQKAILGNIWLDGIKDGDTIRIERNGETVACEIVKKTDE